MCYQRLFQFSPVSGQKGKRIKAWKNKAGFWKLLKANSKGKLCCKYNRWFKNNFQIFFDMVYGVNNLELGINDILQLIELTLGEGNLNIS